MNNAFQTEYLAQPFVLTPAEQRLRELAIEYHQLAEHYDRTVCTGPIKDGEILPANGQELASINRNAHRLMKELYREVGHLGFSQKEWHKAIGKVAIRFCYRE